SGSRNPYKVIQIKPEEETAQKKYSL
uniref:Uncharacterized protein n=1 Tax=Mus spicilegus TaxID=10103 RepID=A0A8C6GBT6_MUSSI